MTIFVRDSLLVLKSMGIWDKISSLECEVKKELIKVSVSVGMRSRPCWCMFNFQ